MFVITEHQYEIIMTQAQKNYPYETGGVLCGDENGIIKGIMPLYNYADGDQKKQFGISHDDIYRGHAFAKKHGLIYYGIYHTHPKGIAYPSEADLAHNQRFLFIISLRDRYNPDFAAYSVTPGPKATRVEIQVINNTGVTIIDINTGQTKFKENVAQEEIDKLNTMIENIIEEKQKYQKMSPKNKFEAINSSFNTEA